MLGSGPRIHLKSAEIYRHLLGAVDGQDGALLKLAPRNRVGTASARGSLAILTAMPRASAQVRRWTAALSGVIMACSGEKR